jgi:hypothetical protein
MIRNSVYVVYIVFVLWCLNRISSKGFEFCINVASWISFCLFICVLAFFVCKGVYYFKNVFFTSTLPTVVRGSRFTDIYDRHLERNTRLERIRVVRETITLERTSGSETNLTRERQIRAAAEIIIRHRIATVFNRTIQSTSIPVLKRLKSAAVA